MTLGIKLQHNSYTGFEYQPSIRGLWKINEHHSFWTAFSRAVRTPARFDQGGHIQTLLGRLGPVTPIVMSLQGNKDFRSERVYTYEVGYRGLLAEQFQFDIALFYSDYNDLRGSQPIGLSCQPSGTAVGFPPFPCPPGEYVENAVNLGANALTGEVYGGEFFFRWKMNNRFSVNGSYSFLDMQLHSKNGAMIMEERDEGASPRNMASLQPSILIMDNVHWDVWLRYTDRLVSRNIPAYITMDSRLAWHPIEHLELSVVGRNLLERSHQEYIATQLGVPPTRIERSIYGQIRWTF